MSADGGLQRIVTILHPPMLKKNLGKQQSLDPSPGAKPDKPGSRKRSHRIAECLGLKKTLKITDTLHMIRLLRAPCNLALNTLSYIAISFLMQDIGASNSQILEVKQIRQKASLAEKESFHGNKEKKEVVCPMETRLDLDKSIVTDGPRILKEVADVITKPLLMIFECSWETGEVPADWKLANIVLIFKKGKNEDSRNYRPFSLTSVPSKIMETIIVGGIEKHLEGNTVSNPN
ncbi:hypothetical protein WISP_139816 [Willisornis vidua]|uniref:RNA-directed DNA polymerase from mobile element jockey n=1 Tax=Willisornis vidua TaxID=1566151 RepID=A0ABQ9CNB4_9PASS|nr:hypothetical protein WISP_139816 [Willisornis vidua]